MSETPTPDTTRPTLRTWLGFGAMSLGMFMAILDVQIVSTSLAEIGAALHIAPEAMSWIQTAYLVAEVVAIALTGRLTSALSMRGLFVSGVVLFTLASLGCAASSGFADLIALRVLQGFAGGVLIPTVFAAGFRLFAGESRALATTIAGAVAVLAPTVGPLIGGWLTDTFSWHALFLVNLGPGVIVTALSLWLLPREPADPATLLRIDGISLAMMIVFLAALMIGLKEAPERGWFSLPVIALLCFALAAGAVLVWRCLRRPRPILDIAALADMRFAVGCALSFIVGVGLFALVYLLPVFLAFVRQHTALEIGRIMLVTGVAQLIAGPVVVFLERRMPPVLLTGIGFALFALGLGLSAFQTPQSDYAALFWPQVIRGVAIMLCLLPPTRIALDHMPAERLADTSGLFNLMRNLGGAVGLALADSIIYGRVAGHARGLGVALLGGSPKAAAFVGLPTDQFHGTPLPPTQIPMLALVQPMIRHASLTAAINDAFIVLAAAMMLALAILPLLYLARPERP